MLKKVDHIQLMVPDVDAAVEWYTSNLGFALDWKHEDQLAMLKLSEGPALMFHNGDSGVHLPNGDDPMSVFVFEADDVRKLHDRLQTVGATTNAVMDEGGFYFLRFSDPFGNRLSAIQHKGN